MAWPLATGTVASTIAPCLKVTLPVADPPYCDATIAVKMTDCVTYDGLRLESNVVVLVAWFKFCANRLDVLGWKLESPL